MIEGLLLLFIPAFLGISLLFVLWVVGEILADILTGLLP